jgi:Na+/proline symporter
LWDRFLLENYGRFSQADEFYEKVMFSNWLLVSVSIGYIGLLFLIAYLGDKYKNRLKVKQQTIIYALSLGVYCTSWGFLGTTAQAANHSLTYLSVYLAPILLFAFVL